MPLRLDLSPILKRLGERIQDENAARLREKETLSGRTIAPRAKTTAKKGELGQRSGDMLADLTNRANIRATATSLKVLSSPKTILRWIVFNHGRAPGRSGTQPPRPVGGISRETFAEFTAEIAAASRDQLAISLGKRFRDAPSVTTFERQY